MLGFEACLNTKTAGPAARKQAIYGVAQHRLLRQIARQPRDTWLRDKIAAQPQDIGMLFYEIPQRAQAVIASLTLAGLVAEHEVVLHPERTNVLMVPGAKLPCDPSRMARLFSLSEEQRKKLVNTETALLEKACERPGDQPPEPISILPLALDATGPAELALTMHALFLLHAEGMLAFDAGNANYLRPSEPALAP